MQLPLLVRIWLVWYIQVWLKEAVHCLQWAGEMTTAGDGFRLPLDCKRSHWRPPPSSLTLEGAPGLRPLPALGSQFTTISRA